MKKNDIFFNISIYRCHFGTSPRNTMHPKFKKARRAFSKAMDTLSWSLDVDKMAASKVKKLHKKLKWLQDKLAAQNSDPKTKKETIRETMMMLRETNEQIERCEAEYDRARSRVATMSRVVDDRQEDYRSARAKYHPELEYSSLSDDEEP